VQSSRLVAVFVAAASGLPFALLGPVTSGGAAGSRAPAPWPEHVVAAPDFNSTPVAEPGTSSAYGIVPAASESVYARLDRLDLVKGKISAGPLVFFGAQLVQVGSSVGVVEPAVESVGPSGSPINPLLPGYQLLQLVEPGSVRLADHKYLRAAGKTSLPFVVASTSTNSAGGLWVVAAGRLLLFDTDSGSVLRSLHAPPGTIEGLVVSPSGSELYLSAVLRFEKNAPYVIYGLDARSGRVLAQRQLGLTIGGQVTAATNSGVWVTTGSGMVAETELMSGPELTVRRPAGSAEAVVSEGGPIGTSIIGGIAWLVGGTGIACASPMTGVVYAEASFPKAPNGNIESFEPFAVAGQELFAVRTPYSGAGSGTVLAIRPSGCHLSGAAPTR